MKLLFTERRSWHWRKKVMSVCTERFTWCNVTRRVVRARTRKSEVVRWPGGIRHWQCGSTRGGKGGTRGSSESFLRCTEPASISLRESGWPTSGLESKPKRLTSTLREGGRGTEIRPSPLDDTNTREMPKLFTFLASFPSTRNRKLI